MWLRGPTSASSGVEQSIVPPIITPISNTLVVQFTCGEKNHKYCSERLNRINDRPKSKSLHLCKNLSKENGSTKEGVLKNQEFENESYHPTMINDAIKTKPAKKSLNSIKTDPLKRKSYKNFGSNRSQDEGILEKDKEKILLTDRKFKNNRIEKSSSKTKINVSSNNELTRKESIKTNSKNIPTPPLLDCANQPYRTLDESTTNVSPFDENGKKIHAKGTSTNLNFQALVKLLASKKFRIGEDFTLIRRKSLSEAATSVIAIATNHCKPLPIALKCSVDGTVSKDGNSCGKVVLVNLNKNKSKDDYDKHNLENHCADNTHMNTTIKSKSILSYKDKSLVKRDSDEEFYSCDDDDGAIILMPRTSKVHIAKSTTKSSPSLTSRMAAKITETTKNYKNRKAHKCSKKKKKTSSSTLLVQTKRPEYYKQFSVERLHSTSIVRQPSDRRPDVANTSFSSSGNTSQNASELQTSQSLDVDTNALDAEKDTKRDRSKSKSAPVSVNRSESYKERLSHKRNRNNRRKTSDPSLSSKPNDDQPDLGLSNSNYTASSNSSLSSGGGSESPSTSMEQVGPMPTVQNVTNPSSNIFSANAMIAVQNVTSGPRQWIDSDDDDDLVNEVDWSSNIAAEVLAALTDAEKKRQEIINEIYQTERSHVRTLKLLEGIFMRPLQESCVLPSDHLHLLFPPALLTLKELHSSFEQKLKLRRIEHNNIVQHVGDLLVGMFDGLPGEELREHAAKFCARQQIALEALKEKRRKDENLQRFLTKAESHKACRRLQLKDLLPTVLQRLTKYPLLFENLYKITKRVVPDDNAEAEAVQRALDSSKRILVDVNQAVKTAEDAHKLQSIQRKLDKTAYDKEEFRNLDLTQLKLIHDGSLTMKKNPGTQLHGLLFENMMLLLTKQDDKYALKNFQNISASGTTEVNKFISPITYFDQQTLVRQSAVDKNTFFLIITKTSQMLELRAPSSSECKTWFKHISDAAEQYKQRSKSSHEVVDDPASATLPHSNTKESLENTPESQTPSSAKATATTAVGNAATNNNISEREYTPSSEKDPNSFCSNNNALDLSGAYGGGTAESSINRTDYQNESNNNEYGTSTIDQHQQALSTNASDEAILAAGTRRDNSSLYSNNSNNTRTLMQNSPLVEPSAIQISISPAHTAEPVLTPSERLKRLDNSIRENLVEKHKIICDMFRLPIEHFNEIVDIVAQPEAPKDSSDIALAAYAQVQSLTEVLNDYMKINSTEQEISAVSTVVCDQCHQTQHQQHLQALVQPTITIGSTEKRTVSPLLLNPTSTISPSKAIPEETLTSFPNVQTPPAEQPVSNIVLTSSVSVDNDQIIHEDDDGYCEIDELRLPSVPISKAVASSNSLIGTFKVPLPTVGVDTASRNSSTPELMKRQSTISTDSIPEESEHDVTQLDEPTLSSSVSISKMTNSKDEDEHLVQQFHKRENSNDALIDQAEPENINSKINDSLGSEHIEINDNYDTLNLSVIDSNENTDGHKCQSPGPILCGPNRLLHANSLEPSVPCHLINGIVSTLNLQISLLLPKINERDQERERLRRENQHLRELLNAMHERQRVEANTETPAEITISADSSNETAIITAAVADQSTIEQTPFY